MNTHPATDADDHSWEFFTYPIETPAAEFDRFGSIINLWRDKHSDCVGLPAWRDFELEDFEGWWGQLAMGEANETRDSVKFVLWGTRLTTWWGRDYTGKDIVAVSSLKDPAYTQQVDYYRSLFSGCRIGFNCGNLGNMGRGFICARCIDLPLSTTHDIPTHVLSAVEVVDPEELSVPALEPLPME